MRKVRYQYMRLRPRSIISLLSHMLIAKNSHDGGQQHPLGFSVSLPQDHDNGALRLGDHHKRLPDHEGRQNDHSKVEALEGQLSLIAP